jgi:hypothetical protein
MEGVSIQMHDPMANRSVSQLRALSIARQSRSANSFFRCRINLIVQAEKIGITPDCNDILAEITTKITTLTQTLKVVTAA